MLVQSTVEVPLMLNCVGPCSIRVLWDWYIQDNVGEDLLCCSFGVHGNESREWHNGGASA
jgi:hypothetical protein